MPIPFPRHALPLALLLALVGGARADDAPVKCRYVEVGNLPLGYASTSFQPVVDGVINGAAARFLVDTGASRTYLTRTAAERLDLSLKMTGTHVNGIGGSSRVYSARLDDFAVGPTHSGRTTLRVIDEMGGKPPYDAIVGADFLLQADMEISLAEKKLRFFRPSNCKDTFLAYWSGDAFEVPFTGGFGDSRNQVFTVELNGVKLDALIDTGASRSAVFVKAAQRAGVRTDAPGTLKGGDVVGVGSDRVQRWSAVFDTFAIGNETIRNAEIDILAAPSSGRIQADVLLGADFLRTHRVLFAMSQERLYISYLGGEVFSRGKLGIEPWLQQEADGGNADAQFVLASRYRNGSGVARDLPLAANWLEKAAQQGHPGATLQVGVAKVRTGQYAEAVPLLSRALSQLPDDRHGALYLYLARLQSGDGATATRELDARFASFKERRWPGPIADFYLGRIDADALLVAAGKEKPAAQVCEATHFQSQLHAAQGDKAKARSVMEAKRAECARPAVK